MSNEIMHQDLGLTASREVERRIKPYVVKRTRGWSPLDLREVWGARDLLYFMVLRDLKARYRQTALGPIWIVLTPLVNMVIYTFIFGIVAKLPSDGVPYSVFSYVGLLPWTFTASSIHSGAVGLLGGQTLISKVYFPRLVLPLAQSLSSLMDLGMSFVILVGMLLFYGLRPTWGIVLIPVYLAIAGLFGIGLGLVFSGAIVKYRDFGQVVSYMTRALMYASPVVYSISVIPPELLPLYRLNPITTVIEGFRWALLGTEQPPWWSFAFALVLAPTVFLIGTYIFKRAERTIVDLL